MQRRGECEIRNGGGEYVDQAEGRMIGHQMTAAFGAILPLTIFDFWNIATFSAPDVIRTACGFQRLKALTGPPDHARQELQ